ADIPRSDVALLVRRLKEHCQGVAGGGIGRGRGVGRENRDSRQIGRTLRTGLRADGGQAKPTDEEDPPLHSMTSSARARIDGGTVRPSAIAVLRLTTSSNLVGCSTGRSAGLAPLRVFLA